MLCYHSSDKFISEWHRDRNQLFTWLLRCLTQGYLSFSKQPLGDSTATKPVCWERKRAKKKRSWTHSFGNNHVTAVILIRSKLTPLINLANHDGDHNSIKSCPYCKLAGWFHRFQSLQKGNQVNGNKSNICCASTTKKVANGFVSAASTSHRDLIYRLQHLEYPPSLTIHFEWLPKISNDS